MKKFNVIIFDINNNKFIYYDIINPLVQWYKDSKKKLSTYEEFKNFIINKSQYYWWAKCEWEIILSDWPNQETNEKVDVYKQVMANIDIITEIVMEECLKKKRK